MLPREASSIARILRNSTSHLLGNCPNMKSLHDRKYPESFDNLVQHARAGYTACTAQTVQRASGPPDGRVTLIWKG